MKDTILTRIILPSHTMLEIDATMVNIPGTDGMFGVLPHHSKLVSDIDIGIITIFSDSTKKKYFVYRGIAQVNGTELNITSEFVMDLQTISKSEINAQISKLKSNLSDEKEDSLERSIISDKIIQYQKLLSFVPSSN